MRDEKLALKSQLSVPVQVDFDLWIQAAFDRALGGHPLQQQALLAVEFGGKCQIHRQALHAARSFLGHAFVHIGPASLQRPSPAFRRDAHDREDAGCQCGGQKIGWRKLLAESLVVDRGVSAQQSPRCCVSGFAVKVAGVTAGHGGHGRFVAGPILSP